MGQPAYNIINLVRDFAVLASNSAATLCQFPEKSASA